VGVGRRVIAQGEKRQQRATADQRSGIDSLEGSEYADHPGEVETGRGIAATFSF
jgi:hypothetical protein